METAVLTIDEELQDYISKLDILQKKSLLELIKSFSKEDKIVEKPQTLEEYNKELEEAEVEYKNGETISQEAMLNEIKKW